MIPLSTMVLRENKNGIPLNSSPSFHRKGKTKLFVPQIESLGMLFENKNISSADAFETMAGHFEQSRPLINWPCFQLLFLILMSQSIFYCELRIIGKRRKHMFIGLSRILKCALSITGLTINFMSFVLRDS